MAKRKIEAAADKRSGKEIVASLRAQYKGWEPVRGESRRLLYKMLGDMYVAIPVVEADPDKLQELRDLAREDENVSKSNRFDPGKADSVDLLLVCILSLKEETRATKSQWRSVILAASVEEVPHTSEAFQAWVKERGGIVEVLKGELHPGSAKEGTTSNSESAADEAVAELVAGKFDLKKWAGEIAKSPPADRLKLEIDPKADLHQGLGVLLYYAAEGDKADEVRIVRKMGDPVVVKHVAAEVDLGHIRNLTDEEKLARALDKRLWTLNKVTLILAGRLRAKITVKEFKAFVDALRAIVKADQNAQNYFKGFGGVVYGNSSKHGEFFTMQVKNPNFLEVDPGRYLGGARKGALIPYDVSKIGKPEGDAAMKAYIMQHTEPWRFKDAR